MKTKISAIILITIFSVVSAQSAGSAKTYSEADSLLSSFLYDEALNLLIKTEKQDTSDFEILQRISRTYVLIGDNLPENTPDLEDRQEEFYIKALKYAERAVHHAPGQSINYLRRAIANGKIALFKGVFSVADVVDQVRDDAEKAIELNRGSNETIASAHYVLGRTHAKISEKWKPARSVLGLGWADVDSAIVHYDEAVKIRPGFLMYYVDYAKALIREDEYVKARKMLNEAVNCEIKDKQDNERINEAKELLTEIEDE